MQTANQTAVLEFVKAELAAGRPFPSTTTINVAIGWERGSGQAGNTLLSLAGKGILKCEQVRDGKRWAHRWEVV